MIARTTALTPIELQSAVVRNPLVVSPDATLMDAIAQMTYMRSCSVSLEDWSGDTPQTIVDRQLTNLLLEARSSCVVVVEGRQVVGIVTERDIVRLSAQQLAFNSLSIRQVMSHPVLTLQESAFTDLFFAVNLLHQHHIRHLPIVNEQEQLVGLLTYESLLQSLNPLELYKLAEGLGKKVQSLEDEKIDLLQTRTAELEQQVETRTATLNAKAERETLLTELSTQIRASLNIQTILDTTVEQVRHMLGCDRVTVWQVEEDWQTIVVAESTESPLSLLGERINDTCFRQGQAELYRQEHIRIVSDIYSIDMSDCHRELLIRIQTRAKILVPILCGDKLWGFLNATESQHARDWMPHEVQLLSALAVQLAIALQQATMHQHLQHELTERALAETQLKALNIQNQERVIELEQTNEELQSTLEALKESEKKQDESNAQVEIERQRYQDLFNFAPDGYLVTDTAGVIHDGNERIFEQLATISDFLIGKAFVACIAQSDYSLYYLSLEKVVVQNKTQIWEMMLKPRSGDPFPVEVTVAPIYASDQTVTELLWLIHDISERKKTETVLQNLIEGTAATTGEDFFPAMVQYVAEALNVSYALVSELVGEELHVLAFSADGVLQPTFSFNSANTPCERAWQDGLFYCERFVQQRFPIHLDLKKMGVQSYLGVALRDNYGKPIGNLCILDQQPIQDIERIENLLNVFAARAGAELERKNVTAALEQLNQALEDKIKERTAALQASENRYATLAAAAPVAIFRFERDLNCIYVSDRWSELTGRPIEEALEYGWLSALHPEDRESLMNHITQQEIQIDLRLPERTYFEGRHQFLDGSIRWFYAQVTPEIGADGNALGYISTFTDITRRKHIEAELAESESKFRHLVERASDVIFSNDKCGNITYFSPQFKTLLGWNPDEWIGHPFMRFIHPEDQTLIAGNFKKDLLNIGFSSAEFRHLHQDGRYIWVRVNVSPVKDADGNLIGMQGILSDISDRKQMEYKLQESQQFIQTVLDTFPLSVFWKDRNSVYLGCNRHFLKDADLTSVQELIGKTDYEMPWGSTQADGYRKDDQQVMHSHAAKLRIVETQLQADGKQIWVETNKLPLFGIKGELIGVLGTYQDISHQKQVELIIHQRAEQETLLREITQRIRQSLDLQTIFDTACQEIRQLMKADRVSVFQFYGESSYDDGEFVAEAFVEGISSVMGIQVHDHCFGEKYAPLYLQGRYAAMSDIFRLDQCHTDVLAKLNVRANLVMPLLCGDDLWGLLCIHQCSGPRHWQQDEINLTQQLANQLAIAVQQANLFEQLQQELLERQQAQRQLTERNQQLAVSNEELARATRLKDEFLANMSHELRTPLNAILGMTEGLTEEIFGTVNERQIKSLNTINHSGTHLLALINDILDVAKIESGHIELDFTPVSATKLCQSSLALIKQQATQKRIQIITDFSTNLPELCVDERRIRQVLINLLSNAVKFTPEGGHITLEAKQTQPCFIRIAVTDTGIGIAPEHINKLFQPFIQIDSALNRQYQGTGLGLALVKRIVELHRGHVNLTSQLGVGSCFMIDLPCAETACVAVLNPKSTHRILRDSGTFGLLSVANAPLILLAEDNEANIATMTGYLEAKGYRIVVAKNGRQAIALAQAETPDLILMDIQMPEMDGLEAMQQIRHNPDLADIPIIALTALAMTGDRERCLAAGANDYLSKPIRLKHLVTKIQEILNFSPS